MKRNSIITTLLLLLIVLISCSKSNSDTVILDTKQDINGKKISIIATRGENWSHKQKFGMFSITIYPQFAVWIEDTEGNFLETLYVTKAYAKQIWQHAEYNHDQPFRLRSLPYWRNKRLKANKPPVTRNNPLADTLTGATPEQNFRINSTITSVNKKFVVYAEFNKSFDYNSKFSKENKSAEINGQPSVVYSATIDLDSKKAFKLKLAGHGSMNSNDGSLYKDTSNLTTALQIIKELTIKIND